MPYTSHRIPDRTPTEMREILGRYQDEFESLPKPKFSICEPRDFLVRTHVAKRDDLQATREILLAEIVEQILEASKIGIGRFLIPLCYEEEDRENGDIHLGYFAKATVKIADIPSKD